MKLHSIFLILSLVATLNAEQTLIEKYTELRNDYNIGKIESNRNLVLESRNDAQELRVYKDALRECRARALNSKVEKYYSMYR